MKNQQGIIWTPIMIIVATVVVAGVAGYFLFKAGNNKTENQNVVVVNQAKSNADTNATTNTNQALNTNSASNTNSVSGVSYFPISEWNVEFPAGQKYTYSLRADINVANFSTEELESKNCLAKDGAIGAISRSSTLFTEGPLSSQTPIVIDGQNYYFTSPQSSCSSDSATTELQTLSVTTLRNDFKGLKRSNPTAGWKMYENKVIGYSFRHPVDFTQPDSEEEQVGFASPRGAMQISLLNVSLDVTKLPKPATEIVLGGRKAYRYTQGADGGCTGPGVITSVRNKTLRIFFSGCSGKQIDEETMTRILDTFTFNDPTAAYKTWTVSEYNFSIMYPGDWSTSTDSSSGAKRYNLTSPDQSQYIHIFPTGEFDAGPPANKRGMADQIGGALVTRWKYWDTSESKPIWCYYQFSAKPEPTWTQPTDDLKGGNRIETTCTESLETEIILSTLTITK